MKGLNQMKINQEELKKAAGEASIKYVEDGMKIGLGSGSTVYWLIQALGQYIKDGGKIEGIPSSEQTQRWAAEAGVPLTTFSKVEQLDVTIDGADEVDKNLQLIKGGGGALFREKIIAAAAKTLIIIVDETKKVKQLGRFPLPVEVLPFGWEVTANRISKLGGKPELRKKDGDIYRSDNGNYILDCSFSYIADPAILESQLKNIVGVVETGLFVNMADKVIVGKTDGLEVIEKKREGEG
ncbi:ribose-5-phosphate isomerase RpiA [Virgibacillus halodenitrificans]|uniref:ribose-5-phosphate isomerase RpiA n=2 Tax=Virgibacillus halodenitrificans TaxID=1482 RepID=UPI00136B2CB5|nr:ribose-5-phosphate isomerase RpiA [Virgibacillus halodenitrificans]MCJ0930153.1 ribose-5-phosphate isomerase RpiA [Virgibacillus halodenitrificans]MYL45854.1 ribose-5-phosphate isomerase RpiA [Virgibacillus halodenitrificans]